MSILGTKVWRTLAVSCLLASSAAMVSPVAANSGEESETYRDVDGNLTERWIWGGADPEVLKSTFEAMKSSQAERSNPELYDTIAAFGPGHWTYEFLALGDGEMARAATAAAAGDRDGARDAYFSASNYYQIGKFPFIRTADYPYYLFAYKRSMVAYEKAGEFLPVPLEVVNLPYKGRAIRGYLHLTPAALENPAPLVIVSGGIDTFKVEHYPLVKALNEAGMSALVVDLPGVGESNFLPSNHKHDAVYSAFLDALSSDPRIDGDNVGAWAASWGGNAAARAAFTDDRFGAVVSACGPVHAALSIPDQAARQAPDAVRANTPKVVFDVVTDRLGMQPPIDNAQLPEFADRLRKFSLVEQGLVGGAVRTKTPVMVINTRSDSVAPPEDMEALAAASENGKVFYTDGEGHCGSRVPIIANSVPWLASHLLNGE